MVSGGNNGRNWRVGFALIGLFVLTGAQQKPEERQTNASGGQASNAPIEAAAPSEAPESPHRPYPNRYSDACYNADKYENADLCAQWRAAIATEKAANEARIATIAAIIGTVLSLVTVMGLIITIYQTSGALGEARRGNRLNLLNERRARRESREAAKDTQRAIDIAERNADAAYRQIEISQNAADAQLMPYIYIEKILTISIDQIDQSEPNILVKIKNFGKTPATKVKIDAKFRRCETGKAVAPKIDLRKSPFCEDIPPNHTRSMRIPLDVENISGTIQRILDKKIILVVGIRYSYAGLNKNTAWRESVIIFDHMGPRQPVVADNLQWQ